MTKYQDCWLIFMFISSKIFGNIQTERWNAMHRSLYKCKLLGWGQ